MRRIVIILFLFSNNLFAQDVLLHSTQFFPEEENKQIPFLKNEINALQDDEIYLVKSFEKKSKQSAHYLYNIYYQNVKVFNNYIKVNANRKNQIQSLALQCFDYKNINKSDIAFQISMWNDALIAQFNKDSAYIENEIVLCKPDDRFEICLLQRNFNLSNDYCRLVRYNGEIVFFKNLTLSLQKDTFINAHIFLPDPLSSLHFNYGGVYADHGDSNQTWMNPAYIPENIDATYDSLTQKFLLQNVYAKIVDFESPYIAPATSSTNNFYFTRDESGFEDCNVLYHITAFQKYMSSLGYDTFMNVQVQVDAHGQFGNDNSAFNKNGGAPTLSFGVGGVDDAEDADVIIHEYSHGISWSANGNIFLDYERTALDEGIADYFATSYSRRHETFNYDKVFTWDGHNEFWPGRNAYTTKNYALPLTGDIYSIGEIWNDALQQIYTQIGPSKTDALMLETLLYLTENSTLAQAAYFMLQADTILYGGANRWTICNAFKNKNILAWDCYPLQITEKGIGQDEPILKNTWAFANGQGDIIIDFNNKNATIELFDMQGKCILKEDFYAHFQLSPQRLISGMFLLKISFDKGFIYKKLSKF